MSKITTKDFDKRVKDLGNKEYELLSEYINVKTKVTIRHLVCKNIYEVRPDAFTSGQRCPKCFGNNRKTNKDLIDILGDEYELLSEYINNKTKVKVKHLACKTEYETLADHILRKRGYKCPKCKGNRVHLLLKKTSEQFQKDLNRFIGNNDYKLVSEYVNQKNKVKVKHLLCETEFEAIPNKILYGSKRCPKCFPNKSLGEMLVEQYLINNEYIYSTQYTFNNCMSEKGNLLRFDFAVFNDKNILQALIEYDGQQHYYPVKIFGGEKEYNMQKINDLKKDEYCRKNNINLVRIHYDINNYELLNDFLVDKIIKKEMNEV